MSGVRLEKFLLIWDITSHQILSFVRNSWPFKQRGFLSVLLLFWHPFIMVISENPWHSHLLPSYWQRSCHYLFYDWGLSRLGFEHSTFRMRGERPKRLRHRSGVPNSLACCWWPNREDVPFIVHNQRFVTVMNVAAPYDLKNGCPMTEFLWHSLPDVTGA